MEDTPRSTNSSGTPRDDRFFSPRENSFRSARSSSSSEAEWLTPRQQAAQSYRCNSENSDDQYFSARNSSRGPQDSDMMHQQQQYEYEHDQKQLSSRSQYSQNFDSPRGSITHQKHRNQQSTSDHSEHDNYQDNLANGTRNRNDQKFDGENSNSQWSGVIRKEDVESIFMFARRGRGEEIESLLHRGIPVDVKDDWGNTVLIVACQNGNKRIAKIVLRRGANINCRNFKGNSALHYCFHYGYGDTLGQYLIQKGADEGVRNNLGRPCWDGV